jgi:chlorophyll synthase
VGRVRVGVDRDLAAPDGDAEVIRRIRLLLLMARFRVAVTMWTFMLLGVARHAEAAPNLRLFSALVALAASYAVATSLNDVADAEIDHVNRPRDASRPLIAGTASPSDLRVTAAIAAPLAAVAALPLGPGGIAAIGCGLLLAYCYSAAPIRLSHRSLLAPLTLTVAYVAVPYALGIVVAEGRPNAGDVPLVAGLLVLFFARIILKDLRDRLGDEAFGKPTLLLRLGKDAVCVTSVAGVVLGTGLILVGLAAPAAIATVLLAEAAGIVWMLVRLRTRTDPREEQIAIGTAARAGNALLITALAWLLLSGDGASMSSASLIVGSLGAIFAVSFLDLALRPDRVRIGYKA